MQKLLLLTGALFAVGTSAASTLYRTDLYTNLNPLTTGIRVEWNSSKSTGSVDISDLNFLSISLLGQNNVLIYRDVVIDNGTLQPIVFWTRPLP